jgi:putative ABC transport system ATP-binding protein
MLTIDKAYKIFGKNTQNENPVLNGLDLHLNKGEFVTIIGSNGAGKSTLFSAIAGTITLDSGAVLLDGQDISYMPEHIRARTIGRLFQNPLSGTAPNLTIEENLALVYSKATKRFPLALALRSSDRRLFAETLSSLDMGLEKRLKTRTGLLSGGQRQALTLLLATLVPPKLLLLDEHTAALDPVSARKILHLTEAITAEHTITTLMITHNISSALELGTRTIMLHQGTVMMDLHGHERQNITTEGLLKRYKETVHEILESAILS